LIDRSDAVGIGHGRHPVLVKMRFNVNSYFHVRPVVPIRPLFYLSPELGENVQEFIRGLVAGDVRFLFGGTKQIDKNYNYNDNTKLIQAITKGFRGAFWDILRRVEEEEQS
jgi:hypothetical protein